MIENRTSIASRSESTELFETFEVSIVISPDGHGSPRSYPAMLRCSSIDPPGVFDPVEPSATRASCKIAADRKRFPPSFDAVRPPRPGREDNRTFVGVVESTGESRRSRFDALVACPA